MKKAVYGEVVPSILALGVRCPMCQKRGRGLLEGCDEILVTLAKQRTINHLEGNQHVWTCRDRLMTLKSFQNVSF